MARQSSLYSRLNQSMFDLTIWCEQHEAIAALQAISKSVLGNPDALNVDGDYFSMKLPNGEVFRGLLIDDNVEKVRNMITEFGFAW